jgi:hypothetical protein
MEKQRKRKRVEYETALVSHIDILGFRELINTETPGNISKILRVFSEAIEPTQFKIAIPRLSPEQFISFSDLTISVIPLRRANVFARGAIFMHLLRMVHAQATLFYDHGLLIRGGIVVGEARRSYRRFFGPAVIRAYEVESQEAIYPRIVVDQSVINEVKVNPQVWTHDRASELSEVRKLLRRDDENGVLYVDYLNVIRDELDDPSFYATYLEKYHDLIAERLRRYPRGSGARRKYEWMSRYYRRVVRNS